MSDFLEERMTLRDAIAKALHDNDDWIPDDGHMAPWPDCGHLDAYRDNADAALKVVADWLRTQPIDVSVRKSLADALTKAAE